MKRKKRSNFKNGITEMIPKQSSFTLQVLSSFCQTPSLLSVQLTVNLKVSSILGLRWNVLYFVQNVHALTDKANYSFCYCMYFKQVYQEEINFLGNLHNLCQVPALHPSAMSFKAHCSGWVFGSAQHNLEDCFSRLFLFWSFFNIL